MSEAHPSRLVPIGDLKAHPRNYRRHPPDQVAHLAQSILEHGFYRNVVAARDLTLLAGHGVVQAAATIEVEEVPVIVLDLDPLEPRALVILAGDNEIARLADVDDRALSEILKEVGDSTERLVGLLGTGYDETMLANLVFVTRPRSEIASPDAAKEWRGLPDYEPGSAGVKLVIQFEDAETRLELMRRIGVKTIHKQTNGVWSIWYPERAKEDLASLRFEGRK